MTGTINDMSSCQRAKPFTGLVNGFPPVVGLAPDPAGFSSSRLSGSLSLTKNQRGRALDGASQASSRFWRERALGTLGADNGGGTGSNTTPPSREGNERPPAPRRRRGARPLQLTPTNSPNSFHPHRFRATFKPSHQDASRTRETRPGRVISSLRCPYHSKEGKRLPDPFLPLSAEGRFSRHLPYPHSYPVTLLLLRENWGIEGFFSLVISRNPPGDLYSNH